MNLKMKLPSKRTLVITAVVVAIALMFMGLLQLGDNNKVAFRTVPVTRGDLLATISATGTVEPEEVIDVGAQVAGKILAFGEDKHGKTVDYGSVVGAGTVLARIDDALYAADVAAAQAQLGQAQATLKRAEADLNQLKAKAYQTQRDWARARKLGPSDALSQSDFDASQSAYEVAKANLEVGRAAIVQARMSAKQAEATLKRAQQNLDYCTIVSPVKGVIIDRRVNIGQTVVASLNAPSLFLIAKDLKRLQVWVSVNEADIGHIHPGQPVTFTVDAYPGEVFRGEVGKVRLNATMTQNVVTYTVEVITDNSSGKLLPYMTANVRFIMGEARQALLVPNAALRWKPRPEQIAPEFRRLAKTGSGSASPSQGKPGTEAGKSQSDRQLVWVPKGTQVRPIYLSRGLSDGTMTAVESPELKAGTLVVVGEAEKTGEETPTNANPFTPKFFRKKSNGK
jgi:HlyD family secretion protein